MVPMGMGDQEVEVGLPFVGEEGSQAAYAGAGVHDDHFPLRALISRHVVSPPYLLYSLPLTGMDPREPQQRIYMTEIAPEMSMGREYCRIRDLDPRQAH